MKLITYCNRIIEYSFYSLLFLVPLVFSGATSELFELNKMWLTFGVTAIIVAAWASKMVLEKRIIIQRTPLDIPIMLFLVSQIIATLISLDPQTSWWGYYSRFNGGLLSTITYIVLYYAFVTNFANGSQTKESKLNLTIYLSAFGVLLFSSLLMLGIGGQDPSGRTFLMNLAVIIALVLFIWSFRGTTINKSLFITLNAGLLTALWAFPAHYGADPTCLLMQGQLNVACWTEAFQPTVRTFSTLGQPAWFAAYLALLTPLAMAYALKQTSAKVWLFIVLAIFFYINLLFANTQAGIVAFWVANLFFWLAIYIKHLFPQKNFLRAFILFNVVFLICTFVFGDRLGPLSSFTLSSLMSKPAASQPTTTPNAPAPTVGSGVTDSGDIRVIVWKGAIDAWKNSPLIGTGVETFAFAYYKNKPIEHNMTSEWDFLYNKAHNEYLNYLTTTGLLGLGTYLAIIGWFIFQTLRQILKSRNATRDDQTDATITPAVISQLLIITLFAGFITILITNFIGFSVVLMNLYLFLIPAFVLILGNMLKEDHALNYTFGTQHDKQKHPQPVRPFQWTLIGIIVVIAGWQIVSLLIYHQADTAYALGSNLDKTGNFQQAYPSLIQAVETKPEEPVYKDELAINLAAISSGLYAQGDAKNAAQLAQNAIDLNTEIVTTHPNNVVFWKNRVRLFYTLSATDQANSTKYLLEALKAINKAKELAPTDAKITYNQGILYGQTGDLPKAVQILEEAIKLKPDYRDAYVALGLFYHQMAVDENDKVVKPEFQQKAITTYQYILDKLNPQDEEVKKTLKDWQQN